MPPKCWDNQNTTPCPALTNLCGESSGFREQLLQYFSSFLVGSVELGAFKRDTWKSLSSPVPHWLYGRWREELGQHTHNSPLLPCTSPWVLENLGFRCSSAPTHVVTSADLIEVGTQLCAQSVGPECMLFSFLKQNKTNNKKNIYRCFAGVHVWTPTHVPSAFGGQRRLSGPLELE